MQNIRSHVCFYRNDIKDGQEFEIVAGADVKPKEEEEKQKNGMFIFIEGNLLP